MKPIQLTRVGPCRVCGAENWHTFLDLGQVPLANSFMTDPSVTEECLPPRPYVVPGVPPACRSPMSSTRATSTTTTAI